MKFQLFVHRTNISFSESWIPTPSSICLPIKQYPSYLRLLQRHDDCFVDDAVFVVVVSAVAATVAPPADAAVVVVAPAVVSGAAGVADFDSVVIDAAVIVAVSAVAGVVRAAFPVAFEAAVPDVVAAADDDVYGDDEGDVGWYIGEVAEAVVAGGYDVAAVADDADGTVNADDDSTLSC